QRKLEQKARASSIDTADHVEERVALLPARHCVRKRSMAAGRASFRSTHSAVARPSKTTRPCSDVHPPRRSLGSRSVRERILLCGGGLTTMPALSSTELRVR